MNNIKKLKRTAHVAAILTKYGFDTIVSQTKLKKIVPGFISPKDKSLMELSIYERIRMAIEELGSTFVKLGQLLSTRNDILPDEMIVELKKLRDEVPAEEINISEKLEEELGIEIDDVFLELNETPIAAASLAQVYRGKLVDGSTEIILKVKRSGVQEMIESDLLIIKDIASTLEKYDVAVQNIGLTYIVSAFERSILSELSFMQELNNIERFRCNFKDDESTHVPVTYPDLSNNNILCMEYIDGIKISDKESLKKNGLEGEAVAKTVVDLYMKQVFDFGFFHSDPHAGNVFVLTNGKVVFIDFGSVGRLLPSDRDSLAEIIIYVLRKDVKRLAQVIHDIAVHYEMDDEKSLERELYDLIMMVSQTPIKNIDLKDIAGRFSRVLSDNKVVLPDYMYLIIRGIVLLEGIGNDISPNLNIIDCIKPYGYKLTKEKMSPSYIFNKGLDKAIGLENMLEDLPTEIHSLLEKANKGNLHIAHSVSGLADIKNTINRLVVSIIILALSIGSSILIISDVPPKIWNIQVFGFLGFLLAGFLSVVLVIDILRNKKEK